MCRAPLKQTRYAHAAFFASSKLRPPRSSEPAADLPAAAPAGIRAGAFYGDFLRPSDAAFALRRPAEMRFRFGCDGVDKLHPSFAAWTRHPIRALLRPASRLVAPD